MPAAKPVGRIAEADRQALAVVVVRIGGGGHRQGPARLRRAEGEHRVRRRERVIAAVRPCARHGQRDGHGGGRRAAQGHRHRRRESGKFDVVLARAARIGRQIVAEPNQGNIAAGIVGINRGETLVAGESGFETRCFGYGNGFERGGGPANIEVFPAVRRRPCLGNRVNVGVALVIRVVVRLDEIFQFPGIFQVLLHTVELGFGVQRRDDHAAVIQHHPSARDPHRNAVRSDEFPGPFVVHKRIEQQIQVCGAGDGQVHDAAGQRKTGTRRQVESEGFDFGFSFLRGVQGHDACRAGAVFVQPQLHRFERLGMHGHGGFAFGQAHGLERVRKNGQTGKLVRGHAFEGGRGGFPFRRRRW